MDMCLFTVRVNICMKHLVVTFPFQRIKSLSLVLMCLVLCTPVPVSVLYSNMRLKNLVYGA